MMARVTNKQSRVVIEEVLVPKKQTRIVTDQITLKLSKEEAELLVAVCGHIGWGTSSGQLLARIGNPIEIALKYTRDEVVDLYKRVTLTSDSIDIKD
jgi:hypothetical protein